MQDAKHYTVAVRTEFNTYAPVQGLPLMTLAEAQRAALLGRDNGIDAVAYNMFTQ